MPAQRLVPDDRTLAAWVAEGLTHAQIAQRILDTTGHRVARSTVSVALHRAGLAEDRPRFKDTIPWRLRGTDLKAYPIRMLRLLGKRRAGMDLNAEENKRLDSWLRTMDEENAVVAYDPDVTPSIFYIDRQPNDPTDIPIHIQRVWLNPNARRP